jgi:hypothetical protein
MASLCCFVACVASKRCAGSGHVEFHAEAARGDCRHRTLRRVTQDPFVREERAGLVTVDGIGQAQSGGRHEGHRRGLDRHWTAAGHQ